MSLNLPEPDRSPLARSPLALVVCQVRFDEVLAVSDTRTLRAMHEALGGRHGQYPKAEKLIGQAMSIQFSAGAASAEARPQETGWRLSSPDGRWAITLMPTYVALETSAYTSWGDDFRPRLQRLIEATAEHIAPELEQRLGLRYVNRITEPRVTTPQEWRGYIADEFLGVLLHEHLGPAARAAQQQIDLDLDQGILCGLRHGFFVDPARDRALTYVLDFDVYREGALPFDPSDIMTTVDAFNTLVLQLFQQAITPQMRAVLAGEAER